MNKLFKLLKNLKNKEYIFLTLILFGAFMVRLYKITNPIADWHSWRQADTSSVSRTYVQHGINLLFPRYQDISSIQTGLFNPNGYRFVEFPFYNAAQAVLYEIYPYLSLEIWGRLVSIFLSLASTYIIFLLGRRFISKYGGVLSAFFFAFIPYNIYYSRVILPEPLVVFLALASTWQFVVYIDKSKNINLLYSSILFSMALLVKPYIFFYALPMVYLLGDKYNWNYNIVFKQKRNYIAFCVVIIPLILWRMWISQFPEGIPFWKWAFNGSGIRFKPSFWYWIFTERIGKLILGSWGLIPLAYAFIKIDKKNAFIQSSLLGCLVYVVIVASANVMHDYYQILIIPPVAIALAYGCVRMWNFKEFGVVEMRSLLIFSVFVALVSGTVQIKEYYNVNRPQIVEAGMFVDLITPKDALVIAPYNGDTAFLYQTNRWGWPYLDRSLDEEIEKGAGYYVSVNYDEKTKEIMQKYKVIEENKDFVLIDLSEEKTDI
jgi:hypothetical protein